MATTITPQSTLTSFPTNGALKSEDLQGFADNAVTDIQTIAKAVNVTSNEILEVGVTVDSEVEHLRTAIKSLENNQTSILKASTEYTSVVDFFSKKNVLYATGTPESNKLIVDHKYGQVYLPAIGYTPVFYTEDSAGNMKEISNLQFSVTPVSEPVVSGYIQSIDTTEARNAVNGQNHSKWVRTISYPLEAPVTEVVCTYEVTLGSATTKKFNSVKVNPFPAERVDILGIWYKTSSTSAWILLEEYPVEPNGDPSELNNQDYLQYMGQQRNIFAAKIKIRQRNWVEQDNKRTFIYGLQELDFKYVEFSKQNSTFNMSDLSQNNHVIVKITAPEGMSLQELTNIESDPMLNLEGLNINDNHMLVVLSKSPDFNTPADKLWSSSNDPMPQDASQALGVTEYYMIVLMKYVSAISSASSPFSPQTTPVLSNVLLTHKIVSTSSTSGSSSAGLATGLVSSAWADRNWAVHKNFVSHMDVYRTVVDTGSNVFIMGDDFWSGYTHRQTLTGVAIDEMLMSLTTSTATPSATGTITYKSLDTSSGTTPVIPFIPKKFRIQSVYKTDSDSAINFKFDYTTTAGAATQIVVPARNNNILWYDVDQVNAMLSFTLSVDLVNSSLGDKPILGQFILIFKD